MKCPVTSLGCTDVAATRSRQRGYDLTPQQKSLTCSRTSARSDDVFSHVTDLLIDCDEEAHRRRRSSCHRTTKMINLH
ncbi:hypothetical protein Q3G72_029058 [Acer saccharum]|nr:hypothetical protein Q3G72_029058 [Acer saccharum]